MVDGDTLRSLEARLVQIVSRLCTADKEKRTLISGQVSMRVALHVRPARATKGQGTTTCSGRRTVQFTSIPLTGTAQRAALGCVGPRKSLIPTSRVLCTARPGAEVFVLLGVFESGEFFWASSDADFGS